MRKPLSLIGLRLIQTERSKLKLIMDTANGVSETALVVRFMSHWFKEPVEAQVLDSTLSVLSKGKRCMTKGFCIFLAPRARYSDQQTGASLGT